MKHNVILKIKVCMCVCVCRGMSICMCMCRDCQEFLCVCLNEFVCVTWVYGRRSVALYMYMLSRRVKTVDKIGYSPNLIY